MPLLVPGSSAQTARRLAPLLLAEVKVKARAVEAEEAEDTAARSEQLVVEVREGEGKMMLAIRITTAILSYTHLVLHPRSWRSQCLKRTPLGIHHRRMRMNSQHLVAKRA